MATNNSSNFSLGNVNEQLTMTSANSMAFRGRSQSAATRSLNTIFQVSSTRNCQVSYCVDISCTSSLLGGQSGTVFLEMSPSSSFASGIQELSEFTNSNAVALAIAITVIQINTACLTGFFIPAGNYLRIRTNNNTGTPVFTFKVGQEVIL